MTIQVFGPEATVSALNRAFTDTSPANAIFLNQVSSAKSMGDQAFANAFAASWSGLTNAELSKKVLTNMGILPTTDTSVAALEQALTDYFAAFGAKVSGTNGQVTADSRGFIVLQLASILSNSETSTGNLAVYNAAAVAWNSEVAASYSYSANVNNTTPTASGSTGQSLNLTINQDNIIGGTGDDTISAYATQNGATGLVNTLQGVDTIDGGAGNDTLNATLASTAAATTAPNMKNVENIVVRFTTNNDTLDLGSTTNVTAVTLANSSGNGTLTNIGDLASFSIKNQSSASTTVSGTAGSATTMAFGFDTLGTKTSSAVNTITLNLGAAAASKVTTANVTTKDAYVKVDSSAGFSDVITTATVAATGTNTLLFEDSQLKLTKITVTGDGSVNFADTPASAAVNAAVATAANNAAAAAGATANTVATAATAVANISTSATTMINAAAAAGGSTAASVAAVAAATSQINLTELVTLDAAAAKGGVSATVANATKAITVTTGAGDDYIKVGNQGGSGSSVTLGAGNDTLIVSGKLTNFGKGVNGGDGTDIINLTSSLTSVTDSKLITNFETLDVSGTSANATYDVSLNNFPTVQIDEAINGALAGTVTFDKAPDTFSFTVASKKGGAAVFDTAKAITVTGKDYAGIAANNDTETFNIVAKLVDDNKDGSIQGNILNTGGITVGGNAAATGVENLNITATVTVDGGATASSNVASNYVYTPLLTMALAETITIKGDATVNLTTSGFASNTITKVDASGSTGNIVIGAAYSTGTSIAYFGAAGIDTYTATGKGDSLYTAKGGDQITLAAGRDTLVYKAATDSQITDVNKDGKMTLGGDMGVAGTIVNGAYTTLPTATIDAVGTFTTVSSGAATASSDRIDVTNFAFTGAQRGVENVTAKVSGTTDLSSVTGLFTATAGNRGVAFTNLTVGGSDTYVLIDANKDGNFTAADDLVIKLTGVANINEADFNF